MLSKFPLFIIPVSKQVIFPQQYINIRIPEHYNYEPKDYNNLIGIVCIVDERAPHASNLKKVDNYSAYGTILRITTEEKGYSSYTQGLRTTMREFHQFKALAFCRFKIIEFIKTTPYLYAQVQALNDDVPLEVEQNLFQKGIIKELREIAKTYIDIVYRPEQAVSKKSTLDNENSLNKLLFTICSYLEIPTNEKLLLLQIDDFQVRLDTVVKTLKTKNEELRVAKELEKKVRGEMAKETRQILLKKQLDQIVNELYGSPDDEMSVLEMKIKNAKLPENVQSVVNREFKRLQSQRNHNAESAVIRNYIETVIELPWNNVTQDTNDLAKAEQIQNKYHTGLEKVKQRVLEFLAVRFLKGNSKGSIICFHGPPGVGKTSLGQAIAESLNRKFERISLGGVRDEAEIRGHRRTYVGALPGIIIQALKRCGTKNPVILLDEIDKITRDFRGDPSSALLEVLDPAQNHSFTDHYLALPFDLSNVMFIATANRLDTIQAPLLDRMEVINIPGYTIEEKKDIAHRFLIPKQINENGLTANHIEFTPEAVDLIIKSYTQEAGVRQLNRSVASVCRFVAMKAVKSNPNIKEKELAQVNQYEVVEDKGNNKSEPLNKSQEVNKIQDSKVEQQQSQQNSILNYNFDKYIVKAEQIYEILGMDNYIHEEIRERIEMPGVALGMAWTQSGGKLLEIEASFSKGKGQIEITGQLGDVMKESVRTAIGWIKSNIDRIELFVLPKKAASQDVSQDGVKISYDKADIFNEIDIHVHFPAAAIPKDGPSAGITITVALVSLLTNKKVRSDVAMTGEISLKGHVLPVGGIKEKCLAAYSQGIKTIILPFRNKKDVQEISKEIQKNIDFVFVKKIEQVIEVALDHGEDIVKVIRANQQMANINKSSKL